MKVPVMLRTTESPTANNKIEICKKADFGLLFCIMIISSIVFYFEIRYTKENVWCSGFLWEVQFVWELI